jgi:hypothetical protein
MMSQRFCLFYAGYTASAPSLYYNKLVLLNNYLPEEQSLGQFKNLSEQTHDLSYESLSNIKTAISIANYFKLHVLWQPTVAEEYFEWLKDYVHAFEEEFPLTRIEHYYFYYSRKIAEMLSHIGMIITLCDLAQYLNLQENILKQIDTHLSEIEILIFRHKAATALLSSEPRHGCFRELYNEINTSFEKFKNLKPLAFEAADLKSLQANLEDFKYVVLNGFKKCIVSLKELGI